MDRAPRRQSAAGAGALLPAASRRACFFQKHAWAGISEQVVRARDPEDGEELLAIKNVEGLLSLVQASVLEIHVWGAKLDAIEKPDGITFDLDPDAAVGWPEVVSGAFEVRDRLKKAGLEQLSSRPPAARACTSTRRSSRTPIGRR